MRCDELIKRLELLAPISYACDWDNPGLLAGRSDKEVSRILVALDATDEVIAQAIEQKVDFLLTHHPLIFKPLSKINDLDFIGGRIVRLLQHDISYYAMHTNFDSAPGCMADLAAGLLNLECPSVLEVMGETADGLPYGIGKIGKIREEESLESLASLVKEKFHLPFVTVYGMGSVRLPIRTVAICPGSGKSVLSIAQAKGAQVLITGDIGHHEGIDAAAKHMAVIDAGHYGLEHIFVEFMASYLKTQIDSGLAVEREALHFPAAAL